MDDDVSRSLAELRRRELVDRMHEQLDELLAARDQTERLLRAIVEIGSELDLGATLERIVVAARDLIDAPYGAIGIRGQHGAIATFVHSGIDAETEHQIGRLPVGKGLLGVPLTNGQPLRLSDLTTHAAVVGFPEHHPQMRAFLGVPMTVRGEVFGTLYLADDDPVRTFSETDEMMVQGLASAAATAIDNAQLFERAKAVAEWTKSSREITTALLSGVETVASALRLIAERARELTDAEQAIVLVPSDLELSNNEIEALVVSAAAGPNSDLVVGQQVPIDGSTTGAVFVSGEPVITDLFRYPIVAFTDVGERPAVVVPLRARDSVVGVIAVARAVHHAPFDSSHLELMGDFADHAAIALTLASARDQARELMIVADRERIAHDLHDHVIQRIFAVGMDLQGTVSMARSPQVASRLNRAIDDLQSTINQIRTAVFKLEPSAGWAVTFRQRVQEAVADLTENRDIATTLRISGSTTAVDDALADHAEAVLKEAMSNSVRHSGATSLSIEVAVADELVLDIRDNGCGIAPNNVRHSGLANMQWRAEQAHGTCDIEALPAAAHRCGGQRRCCIVNWLRLVATPTLADGLSACFVGTKVPVNIH